MPLCFSSVFRLTLLVPRSASTLPSPSFHAIGSDIAKQCHIRPPLAVAPLLWKLASGNLRGVACPLSAPLTDKRLCATGCPRRPMLVCCINGLATLMRALVALLREARRFEYIPPLVRLILLGCHFVLSVKISLIPSPSPLSCPTLDLLLLLLSY